MIIAEDLAGYFSGEGIPVTKAELQERAFRLWKTMTESAKAMALLPLPGAIIDLQVGGKAIEAQPVTEPTVEEKDPLKKAYVKGFVARIQSIKNNADNIVAGAGNKKKQLKVLGDEIKSLQDSYDKISPVIDKNPEALAELKQIRDILPEYAKAISAFSKKPSKEGYVLIRDISDGITELQQQYGDRIGEQTKVGGGVDAKYLSDEYIRDKLSQYEIEEYDSITPELVDDARNAVIDEFGNIAEKTPVYRAVSAKDVASVKLGEYEIGESWSKDIDSAREFGLHSNSNFIIKAMVLKGDIDLESSIDAFWTNTYRQRYDISAENELTVKGDAKLEQVSVEPINEATAFPSIPQIIEQIEPETPDQAIGKQYGLEPAETQTRLDDAEVRYRELKNKPTEKRSKSENKELAFLRRNRTNLEAILERETSPLENKIPKKKILALGHRIPELLGMSELERRDFNRKITGQISMKDMTPAQRQQVVTALARVAKERGIDMKEELKTSPLGELTAKLEERKQKPALTRRDKRNMTKLRRVLHSLESGTGFYFLHASRLKRVCRALDNYEDNGPFTRYIYQPVKDGDTQANVNFSNAMRIAIESFNELDIDVSRMMVEVKDVGVKAKLTTAERIGVYALAQNENTMNHLLSEFDKEEVAKIVASVKESEDEMYVADHIKAYFELGWPMFQQIAKASGVASGIVKEKNYITAFVTDKNDLNQTDFMEGLLQQFTEAKKVPGAERTIERKRGARRNIELNIFTIHARAARSIERFKVMAPVAKKVGGILSNRKFKQAINDTTYGHGAQMFERWLQDSIRGKAAYDTSMISKSLRWLRTAGIHYVLGFKVLTAAKQGISFFTAASVHPGMVPLLMANINNSMPGQFEKMEAFVESKSDLVKTRDWNRDLRTAWDTKAVKKMYAGKKLSPMSMRMATAVDHYTVVTVWKSAYQLAQKQNMNEEESVRFADGVIERTQPMGKAVDLPNFFRGNELERNLTVFQNQVNQNGNMLWYDIFGERKARNISVPMMSYRLLVGQIAPALLLGMISRGRPPEDWKEAARDMFLYLVSPFTFLGPWIYNIVTGDYGPRRMIAETALIETGKLGAALRKGDPGKIIKHGARAAGAWSGGKIPLQAITTAEGAWRLANEETEDFRELIWSQYAIKPKKKKKKTGGFTY